MFSVLLQLSAAAVPQPVPPAGLHLRLRLRLEHAQVWREPRPGNRGHRLALSPQVERGGALLRTPRETIDTIEQVKWNVVLLHE